MFGPEPWSDVAGRPWSHWDLWFAAVAVSDHEGSFDDLEARFVAQRRSHVGRQGAESKLSHLADLRSRLEAAGFSAADLATPEVLADRADDSHGNVGQLRRDAWHTYLGIDWQATGLAAEDYWADVCDLAVFEDYALDYQEETPPLAVGARRPRRADRGAPPTARMARRRRAAFQPVRRGRRPAR